MSHEWTDLVLVWGSPSLARRVSEALEDTASVVLVRANAGTGERFREPADGTLALPGTVYDLDVPRPITSRQGRWVFGSAVAGEDPWQQWAAALSGAMTPLVFVDVSTVATPAWVAEAAAVGARVLAPTSGEGEGDPWRDALVERARRLTRIRRQVAAQMQFGARRLHHLLQLPQGRFSPRFLAWVLTHRMWSSGIYAFEAYVERLRSSSEEATDLRLALYGPAGPTVRPEVAAMVAETRRTDARVWLVATAGSGDGYAMAVHLLDGGVASPTVCVSGVDADIVGIARTGWLGERLASRLGVSAIDRWFAPDEKAARARPALRRHLVFCLHDPFEDMPFSSLDLVHCVHLLPRLQPEARRELLAVFAFALRPDGLLVTHDGDVSQADTAFEEVEGHPGLWRRVGSSRPSRLPLSRAGSAPEPARSHVFDQLVFGADLRRRGAVSFFLGRDGEVTRLCGGAGRLVEARDGELGRHVHDLFPRELAFAVSNSLDRCLSLGEVVRHSGVSWAGSLGPATVTLRPHVARPGRRAFCSVFVRFDAADGAGHDPEVAVLRNELEAVQHELRGYRDALGGLARRHRQVEDDLLSAREELRRVDEQVRAAREAVDVAARDDRVRSSDRRVVERIIGALVAASIHGAILLDAGLRVRALHGVLPGIVGGGRRRRRTRGPAARPRRRRADDGGTPGAPRCRGHGLHPRHVGRARARGAVHPADRHRARPAAAVDLRLSGSPDRDVAGRASRSADGVVR
jgi:chemotaxis methyl-accepting protein methylase